MKIKITDIDGDISASYPPFTGNAGKALFVNDAETGVEWDEAASGGGGGGAGFVAPSIIQSKSFIGNTTAVTLDATPTPGNILVAIGTHFNDASLLFGTGWSAVQRNAGATTDGNFIATKVVADGDTTAQTPFGGTTAGSCVVIFEVANSSGQVIVPYATYSEVVAGIGSLKLGIPVNGCLVLGMFSTVSANTAPTGITGATALTTVTGTSTSASPRQITPFLLGNVQQGGETISVAYAGTPRQNAGAVVVLPSVGESGGGAGVAVVSTVTTTTANLLDTQMGQYVRYTNAGTKTLTVQPESTLALQNNGEWHIRNVGAGDMTVAAGAGVTINAPAGGTLVVPRGGTVTLKRATADVFDLLGQTVAV